MMNRILKSMDGNQFYQVFLNNAYIFNIYPINSNRKDGDDLNCSVKILVYQRS